MQHLDTNTTKAKLFGLLTTRNMVRISLLSMMGAILQNVLRLPTVPGFPIFLSLDMADVPTVVGTITMGPIAGILIQLLKNIISGLLTSSTAGVGELANFLIGVAYVIPFYFVYKKTNFILGAVAGTIGMMVMGALANYFILLPFFAFVMGWGMESIISSGYDANTSINSVFTLIVFAILPFNLLKGAVTSIIAYLIYRSLKPILHRL